MPVVTLSERQQHALRTLLSASPVPGHPLPSEDVLVTITQLVPCDAIGAVVADDRGNFLDGIDLPQGCGEDFGVDPELHRGPLYVGMMHWSRNPEAADSCQALYAAKDGVSIGFRTGSDCVAQVYLDRTSSYFTDHDLALLSMITPTLQRLMRERATPTLPACLTVQERRVLTQVAAGHSNAQIAADLFVAPSTVRKHLEHSFRKLGVTSRLAAVAALQGRDLPDLDLKERIERFGKAFA